MERVFVRVEREFNYLGTINYREIIIELRSSPFGRFESFVLSIKRGVAILSNRL